MAHITSIVRIASLLAAAGLLAGCATPSTGATTPAADPTSSSPSPTEPAGPPALESLFIGADSIGTARIGGPADSGDPVTSPIVFDDDHCIDGASDEGASGPGRWAANYEPALSGNSNLPFGVYVDESGILTTVRSYDERVSTEEGIHLGSSLDEVVAAYPDAEVIDRDLGAPLYVVHGTQGRLIIEVLTSDEAAADADSEKNTVFSLTSQLDEGEIYGTYATDASVGGCFFA